MDRCLSVFFDKRTRSYDRRTKRRHNGKYNAAHDDCSRVDAIPKYTILFLILAYSYKQTCQAYSYDTWALFFFLNIHYLASAMMIPT